MTARKTLILIVLVLFISGCAVPQKRAEVINVESSRNSAITYPAELRASYFLSKDGITHYCAEPVPDVALDTLQKISAELSAKMPEGADTEGKFSSELSSKVVQLAGRTELILLAREMLYRACEITVNNPEQADKALSMYMRVAELIENLGKAERMQAEAELLKVSFGADESSACIQEWINRDNSNVAKLKGWLSERQLGISVAMFISGKDYAAERRQFVDENSISCNTR